MAAHDAREQYFLELVNRARMNPAGEAAKYGIGLNDGLSSGQSISSSPKQVLAGNTYLNASATAHSSWMIAEDVFSHTGTGGSSPTDRMTSHGYSLSGTWRTGENIAWTSWSSIDSHHENLFKSAGHRANILGEGFRELGIGSVNGTYDGWSGTLMTTQNFAASGTGVFVTGVAYRDTVQSDNFYSVGEGQGSIAFKLYAGSTLLKSTTTASAGGYAAKTTAAGTVEAVFSGGSTLGEIGVKFSLGKENVKVDLVDTKCIEVNVSATLTHDAVGLRLIGIEAKYATGNSRSNTIEGNSIANVINGGSGNDVLIGRKGVDTLTGSSGVDRFHFSSSSECGDLIKDFIEGEQLTFSSSSFGSLAKGALSSSAFYASSSGVAHDTTDRFIFNTATDTLYFDSNGSASGGVTKIAMFDNGFTVSADDIVIV